MDPKNQFGITDGSYCRDGYWRLRRYRLVKGKLRPEFVKGADAPQFPVSAYNGAVYELKEVDDYGMIEVRPAGQ